MSKNSGSAEKMCCVSGGQHEEKPLLPLFQMELWAANAAGDYLARRAAVAASSTSKVTGSMATP